MSDVRNGGAAYVDADGNRYGVERASNGMFVCVRTNSGGNRKGYKEVAASKDADACQRLLDVVAKRNGWKEVGR